MAMTLRLDAPTDRALRLLATAHGCSKHEAALRAIIAEAARTLSDAHVAQLAHDNLAEYRDAETRLHP
ncbi:CopG family transcriptional regulator [Corynebacterium uberis]|uniref:CopG family transcriptional regulator n=1 Tax=Corynebacterium TaxID=1716 RepID=UPI001D0B3418|nr:MULTISPECIES: CopG family transcriptional regulator [Corynebacterium]MCZ9310142.1 CopG family transcriptional regulator [Corynebacterium sp. c6VSa_13]UDL73283.1 CopG family transcriptional regulator [Corynebacterium uberis]UDL75839.1 CopG family transcriptional regulator [Corynebacterium uberis]UDL78052.1 CopG family transcriptional regulator [Corynebacterium uberis]UDL80334.1 CopG family transcriptional regulator [Corynebacterium uberis]